MVGDLGHEAGLTKLEEDAQAAAKAAGRSQKEVQGIYYSLYGGSAPDVVRKHLNSGVLAKMIAEKEKAMLAIPTKDDELKNYLQDPCYTYVLLGACAMTLGCHLPESYLAMLRKVYTEGGLMPDALNQMKQALFGPNGYANDGTPYDLNIRLLRLQQHHDGTIYQLQTFCIEACSDYTALSYTWGTVTPQFSILVDGKSLIS
jgi:hypothetical protein